MDVAPSRDHVCALHENGTVNCCGDNEFGQLGSFRTTEFDGVVTVDGLTSVIDVTVKQGVSCARIAGGVSCWGGPRSYGRAVPYRVAELPVERAERVIAEGETTCVLIGSAVTCFGVARGEHTFPGRVVDLALAEGEVCAALSNGALSCKAFGKTHHNTPDHLVSVTKVTSGNDSFSRARRGSAGHVLGQRGRARSRKRRRAQNAR